MTALLTALAPALLTVMMRIFQIFGIRRANKRKFLEAVANKIDKNVTAELRKQYENLSFDNDGKDDVF